MKKALLSFSSFLMILLFLGSYNLTAQTQRNPVLEEFTGTWCQWCPCGHTIMAQLQAAYPNAIMIGYHGPANTSNEPFSWFSGNTVINMFGIPYWPAGTVDRTGAPNDRGTWSAWMNTRNSVPATVAIDITRSFNPSTRQFDATIDFTALADLNGQFKYTVILLEDGIVWSQTGNGSCPGSSSYVHKHVVRDMMNGASGEDIINGAWNTNQVISKTINHIIPSPGGTGPDMVWDSCSVVVIVNKVGGTFSTSEIQQAEEWILISPNYVINLLSTSPDVMLESNGSADLSATIRNDGLLDDSYYIDVTMSAPNGWTGEYTTPNGTFPFGQQDLVAVQSGNSLQVDLSVLPNVINGFGEITLQFTSMNDPNISASARFRVVTVSGLTGLIIDASGEGYGDVLINGFEQEFGYPYGIVSSEALYPGVDLTNFNLIAWSTGNALPVFTEDEVNALIPFLDNGGRLLINGQNLGEDIFDPSGQSQFAQSFYNNYLHASYVSDAGLTFFFKGISGDPISDSLNFSLTTLYPRSPDQFIPNDTTASSLFTFSTYPQYNSIKADDGVDRVVYFGFGLEQINDQTVKDSLLNRAIRWLMNGVVVGVENKQPVVNTFKLDQNYPNPFNPSTTITYNLAGDVNVNLKIYDLMGQEVAQLVNEKQTSGIHQVQFDAGNLASGMYFYRLTAGDFISVKKMTLIK